MSPCAPSSRGLRQHFPTPILLQRARQIAAEHDELSRSLAADQGQSGDRRETSKRIGEISGVASALKEWVAASESAAELAAMAVSQDAELRQLALDELEPTQSQLAQLGQRLSASLVPKHAFADMPCLIEVLPGPGGLEGRFFADAVFGMYQKYCAGKGYRARVLKYELADAAGTMQGMNGERGLLEAVLEVQVPGAYDMFRGEAGVHRVQRVPTTEKSGRTHTSAAAVWVLPSFPETGGGGITGADPDDPESDFYVDAKDVRSETMRSSGPGGQHVNKTESAIRLTHVPTGIVVSMQDSRSQTQNRESAMRVLRSRLAQRRREQREDMARNLRNSVLSSSQMSRADKVRTYNYNQSRCTDHRSGEDYHNLPDILAGGETLDRLVGGVRRWLTEREVQAVLGQEEEAASSSPSSSQTGPKTARKS